MHTVLLWKCVTKMRSDDSNDTPLEYTEHSFPQVWIFILSFWTRVICNHITVTSQWARWRFKSPALRLFTQPLFRRRLKKTSKLCVTGLCACNSPVTGKFPAQMASNAENDSIWWRHHAEAWFMWDVAIELFLKFNGGVSKQALKSGHEWSIITHC